MKRKKWFVLAALIGLLLSASFLVVSCDELVRGGCNLGPGDCNGYF